MRGRRRARRLRGTRVEIVPGRLVVLLNLLLAMLLKGKQDETESQVLLSATESTDPIEAIAEARAELSDLENAVGIALLLLSSLPIPIALGLLAYDMRKEALLGYNRYDLWRPEVSLSFTPGAAKRAAAARCVLQTISALSYPLTLSQRFAPCQPSTLAHAATAVR